MQIEYGSDFHFIDNISAGTGNTSINKIYPDALIYFSGRSALFSLLNFGISNYSWKKLYLPTYYCHDVDSFLQPLPIKVYYYEDGPYTGKQLELTQIDRRDSVIVHVNYFGFNTASRLVTKNAFIIEDHTHDLLSEWALNSTADYCFASLRKSLPVPAGGMVWSPVALQLAMAPPENNLSNSIVYMKLSAMLLKKLYLEKSNVEKEDFRTLYLNSELLFEQSQTLATLPVNIVKLINEIDLKIVNEKKIKNYTYLIELIKPRHLLWNVENSGSICPFGLFMFLESNQKRDALKSHLISNNIYPAVLWPHQKDPIAAEFAGRSLLIHCDLRYNAGDMEFIAQIINDYYNGNENNSMLR
ncbi:MAG: hypothetical protein ABI707_00615 [Ferruginibacter sp.]